MMVRIGLFGHDTILVQRALFDRHLKNQYSDRKAHWLKRSMCRDHGDTIALVMDGMDQAKFMWPRAPWCTKSKDPQVERRPILHLYGVIVHGYLMHLYLAHSDVNSGGSSAVEMLCHTLHTLRTRLGINLTKRHIHLQLDNTASSNKNNTLLQFLATQAYYSQVGSFSANFLRAGHTHEASCPNPESEPCPAPAFGIGSIMDCHQHFAVASVGAFNLSPGASVQFVSNNESYVSNEPPRLGPIWIS